MPTSECPRRRRVELFIRSNLPTPVQKRCEAVESILQQLESDGVVAEVETTFWAKHVPVDGGHSPERARYNEFCEWAREAGVCLAPYFDTRECYSFDTGERRTELVLPALCLAIYEDGELTQIAPHTKDGEPQTIENCLTALNESERSTPTPTTATQIAD